MSIWNILFNNLKNGSRTRKPADNVPYPEGFRGTLMHDTNRCTACGTCAYVCSPSAIHVVERGSIGKTWQYNAGQCTFCGRCVTFCPTEALHFDPISMGARPDSTSLLTHHDIDYVHCKRCGTLFNPLPGNVLVKLYGDPLPEEIQNARDLCDECRQRLYSRNLGLAQKGHMARRAGDLLVRQENQLPLDKEKDSSDV